MGGPRDVCRWLAGILHCDAFGPDARLGACRRGGAYRPLVFGDRTSLAELLSDDARIRLHDIGVEQTKPEFIASMDEWRGAVAGATIRHRIEKAETGLVTVIVCYDFPGNDLLTRESFALSGSRITASSQETIAESCSGY